LVIRFQHVEKRYAGQSLPAVSELTFTVPAGSVCVLIGPSGCGKTTILKMVNRLIDPTAGSISVLDRDILTINPVELRRGIGYVIQHIGLFGHMTIFDNIATVPRLLKWEPSRIAQRVDELIALVGLDPELFRHRYPRQLSGGQGQRIGVARALAADPPVMLMDEPFGAIDPITRERLQDEFLNIQRRIRKTIIFVTHDIDEAMKMGDVVAILKDGRILQYGSPDHILAAPADDFVASFLGTGRALRRLDLVRVEAVMDPGGHGRGRHPAIASDAALKEALSMMLAEDVSDLTVVNEAGLAVGVVTLEEIRRVARRRPDPATARNAADRGSMARG
jgi:osmoprotectant transport system ATP-binding protein